MKVLYIVTWYSAHDADRMTAGVFHYEQAMDLKKYCETAIYFPYDQNLDVDFMQAEENGMLTFRRKECDSRLGRWMNYIKDYKEICKTFKPDIIHAHVAYGAGVPAMLLSKLYHVPMVVTEHNPIELFNLDDKMTHFVSGLVYHHSKMNAFVSPHSIDSIRPYFPDLDYTLIYNGVMNPNNVPESDDKYAVPNAINCCIVAAFYDKDIKGYQFLIPAIKKLVDEGVNIYLHICGGGDYQEYYENLAKELGVSEHCIFYGQCDRVKVYQIVRQMDFNVSASIFECSGVSTQEAMLLGKPIMCSRSGGVNSMCTEDTAIVVDRGSTDALVDGIKEMISRLDEFDPDKIRKHAFYNFEIDQVSQQYMREYNKVLGIEMEG